MGTRDAQLCVRNAGKRFCNGKLSCVVLFRRNFDTCFQFQKESDTEERVGFDFSIKMCDKVDISKSKRQFYPCHLSIFDLIFAPFDAPLRT